MSEPGLRELLACKAFVRLWFARLTGTTANQMLLVALGWQMYELTHSAWDLGLVGLAQFLPAMALTLPAGQVADRLHRARIVATCLAVQAGVAAVLMAASQTQAASRELLLGMSVLIGGVRAFQMSAQQALTPLLVPQALLVRAMAASSVGLQAAIIGGPAAAGLVFVAGASAVHACCLVLFVVGLGFMLGVRHARPEPVAERVSLRTLLAGVHYVRERPLLLGALSLDLFAVLLGGATALLPMFARDVLQVGAQGLGLLRSAPAVGALVTSLVLSHRPLRRHVGRWMLGSVALYGLCMLAFGLSTDFALSFAALAVSGAADMVSVVIRQTLVQLETPDAMRGRVGAVNSLFIGASNQLGEFESGATAAWLGPVGSVVLGGVGTVLVALAWFRLFPALAHRDRLD